MSPQKKLSNGFSTVKEAIEAIEAATRDNPGVDMDYLIRHKVWLDRNGPNHNFRIPKIKRLSPEDIYVTKRGNTIEYVDNGEINVFIETPLENELLKDAIVKKYEELVGHEYRELISRGVSTVSNDDGITKPRTRKPFAKEGDTIGSGETLTSNGDNLQV